MTPPQFLLGVLGDSISSGSFIDTKFYAFTLRDASGRVRSPRALYCNSRILDAVPYFSSLFSEGFSEGQTKDIDGKFPPDAHPYTEDYDYMSDSDLEDSISGEDEGDPHEGGSGPNLKKLGNTQGCQTDVSNSPPPAVERIETQGDDNAKKKLSRMGKVAIIRDIGAVTFEALLYFLYTGEIKFAPLSSDPRDEEPAQTRAGDWSTGRIPSSSAKSIYRLADKYDISTLKERAKAHICNNLEHCDVVEEIFSSFARFFPEMLQIQVSILVAKMKEESKKNSEGVTRRRLREKIASLSQPQVRRAADALSAIFTYFDGPMEPLAAPQKPTVTDLSTLLPNWHRVKLALLKSITTGIFIDAQFYAFNKTANSLPFDPKPLYISSIVIEEWGPAITTQTVGINSRAVCLVDGPVDDYESWDGKPFPETHQDEEALTYRTEAILNNSREVMLLMSGAWKTWMSLLLCAYTNEVAVSKLCASAGGSNSPTERLRSRSGSSRSMYTLATTLGIEDVKEVILDHIQSKLSSSNIIQELFSSFTSSHKPIMEMEIEALCHKFIKKDPKLLTDYIQSVASGEVSFFPVTLSLVYDKLAGTAFQVESELSEAIPGKDPGGQTVTTSSASTGILPSTSGTIPTVQKWLKCVRCRGSTQVGQLGDGLHCPRCPDTGRNGTGVRGRPFMICPCNSIRTRCVDTCAKCGATFM